MDNNDGFIVGWVLGMLSTLFSVGVATIAVALLK